MAKPAKSAQRDHVDRFLETINFVFPDLDLEVEGIVDRIGGISRRLNRTMDETLGEFGLDSRGAQGTLGPGAGRPSVSQYPLGETG